MWILPKQLISAFVPDTEALISDLNEQSQVCEQSLLARSKPLPARIWLRKWSRDSWMQHLSGRILKPSHGDSFVTAWISFLGAIPASHLAQPENDWEQKIPATSGPISQAELELCDPESASLKMSKDTSPSDSEKSLQNWNQWVMQRRGEYSARLKSAPHINASGCLSWPTIRASEYKDVGPVGSKSHKHMLAKHYLCAVVTQDAINGQPAQANPNTNGSRQESWSTPHANCSTGVGQSPNKDGAQNLQTQANGKLNPRWVEPLMGLPVGWTMPSCASPVTIEPMNCGCSETA